MTHLFPYNGKLRNTFLIRRHLIVFYDSFNPFRIQWWALTPNFFSSELLIRLSLMYSDWLPDNNNLHCSVTTVQFTHHQWRTNPVSHQAWSDVGSAEICSGEVILHLYLDKAVIRSPEAAEEEKVRPVSQFNENFNWYLGVWRNTFIVVSKQSKARSVPDTRVCTMSGRH